MGKLFQFLCWLSASVLSLLGLVSCDDISSAEEYGCPISEYQVKGYVYSPDSAYLEGIQVVLNDDTTYTDANGYFESKKIKNILALDSVEFTDVDGSDHGGSFKPKKVALDVLPKTQVKKGDGHWFMGGYEYDGSVVLLPKDESEEAHKSVNEVKE